MILDVGDAVRANVAHGHGGLQAHLAGQQGTVEGVLLVRVGFELSAKAPHYL